MEAIEHKFSVMHSDALIVLHPSATQREADAREAVARAESRSREIARIFTRFDSSSELCALNAADGRWVEISHEMAEVLTLAADMYALTDGVFDPAILPGLERAGYDRSFEDLPSDRRASDSGGSRSRCFAELEVRGRSARLPVGVRIDLGGIVKGWTADVLADQLCELGPVLVELGGDISTRGSPPTGERWHVGVEAPGRPGELLAILEVAQGAVATSGTERMRWRVNGDWSHHLIDPRTGEPARTDLRQVTALGDRAARTEVWAKAALILGRGACTGLVGRHGLELLVVPVDGPAIGTPGVIAAASALTSEV